MALTVILICGRALADGLPPVNTRVAITSPTFAAGLGAGKADVERSIATEVATLAHDRYPFLDWRAGAGAAPATLLLTLEEKAITPTASAYYLKYEGILAPAPPFALRFGKLTPLYAKEKREKPFNSPRILQADVVKRVTSDLLTYASEFEDSFISRIPLSKSKPRVDANRHMIVLQLPWESMQAAPDSVLHLAISVKKLPGDPAASKFNPEGEIELTQLRRSGKSSVGGHLGWVRCGMVDTKDWLDPAIADALDQQRIQDTAVYMRRYRYSASTRAESPD